MATENKAPLVPGSKDAEDARVAADAESAAATADVEAANREATLDTVGTHEEALAAGYFGTLMGRIPHEVHEAGNEALRAELYGAAPVPETTRAKDGPLASLEGARAALPQSNDLTTVLGTLGPLRGVQVNGETAKAEDRKRR